MATKKPAKKRVAKKAVKKARKSSSPPFPAYPAWTTAKYHSFLRSALRKSFTRWPPKYEALNAAKRTYNGPNPRQKYEYQCAICKAWYPQAKVEVDHIIPCGSIISPDLWVGFIQRLHVSVEGLRVLCKACHLTITKEAKEAKKNDSLDS